MLNPDGTNEEEVLSCMMAEISASISQDVFDFKCYGRVLCLESFNKKLKIYSALMKKHTKLWQEKRGFTCPHSF